MSASLSHARQDLMKGITQAADYSEFEKNTGAMEAMNALLDAAVFLPYSSPEEAAATLKVYTSATLGIASHTADNYPFYSMMVNSNGFNAAALAGRILENPDEYPQGMQEAAYQSLARILKPGAGNIHLKQEACEVLAKAGLPKDNPDVREDIISSLETIQEQQEGMIAGKIANDILVNSPGALPDVTRTAEATPAPISAPTTEL